MPFSPKQQEYFQEATHRWNIKTGATRSGKTFMDYFVIPKRILNCTGDGLILLLGNTKGTLERNILEPMRRIWGPALVGIIGSNNTVMLFGRRCHALGADKINQVSKLQGSGLEYCYGDEVTTWHEDVFTMLKSRLDKPHSCFDGTCNPAEPTHWFKQFLDSDADVYHQHYTIDDNPFLAPSFVSALKQEYAGTIYYDRYILGLWRAAEGVIYRQFADDPTPFLLDELPTDAAFATIGVDFGGNGSAHAFQCTVFSRDMRRITTAFEYYRREVISPAELEADFVEFVKMCQAHFKVYEAYCDSAEQVLIRGLRNACMKAGVVLDIRNARKGEINDRIRFYCRMMGAGRYKVMRHCTHTIEAFRSAVWKADTIKDERLDDGLHNIDSLDAQEYSTEVYMNDMTIMG